MSASMSTSPASSKPTSPSFAATPSSFDHTITTLTTKHDWHTLLLLTEQRELMDGGVLGKDAELYMAVQMLAAALTGDLISAKFVWKRIPADLRTRSPLLPHLWHLLSPLHSRDTTAFFALHAAHTAAATTQPPTQPPTPQPIADLLTALYSHTQSTACDALDAVYDTIEVDEARRLCGATAVASGGGGGGGGGGEAEWERLVGMRGWVVEGGFVRLRRRVKQRSGTMGLEELDRLTRYVTELEQ